MLPLPGCASSYLTGVHVQVWHAHLQRGCQRVSQKVMLWFNHFASLEHVPGPPGTLCTRNVDSILLEIRHTTPTLVMQIPDRCVPVASALIGVLHASTECRIAFSRLIITSVQVCNHLPGGFHLASSAAHHCVVHGRPVQGVCCGSSCDHQMPCSAVSLGSQSYKRHTHLGKKLSSSS